MLDIFIFSGYSNLFVFDERLVYFTSNNKIKVSCRSSFYYYNKYILYGNMSPGPPLFYTTW